MAESGVRENVVNFFGSLFDHSRSLGTLRLEGAQKWEYS